MNINNKRRYCISGLIVKLVLFSREGKKKKGKQEGKLKKKNHHFKYHFFAMLEEQIML